METACRQMLARRKRYDIAVAGVPLQEHRSASDLKEA
jgi:hypothetical protein